MKVRRGFVSNSSSSSYVVSYPSDFDITDIMEYNCEYAEWGKGRVNYIGIQDVVENFKSWYDFDDYESSPEEYQKAFARFAGLVAAVADEVNAGNQVAYITIPYSDEETLEELHEIDGFKIVKDFS